jgi:hypothetical protein
MGARSLRGEVQPPVLYREVLAGRNDVNVVGLDLRAVGGLGDGQGGAGLEQVGQFTLVVGVQVLHEHERHAGILRERFEERLHGPQPARAGPDADDGEGQILALRLRSGGAGRRVGRFFEGGAVRFGRAGIGGRLVGWSVVGHGEWGRRRGERVRRYGG